jgi:predicted transcriptional regulator
LGFTVYGERQIYILLYTFIRINNWWLFLSITGATIKKLRMKAGLTQKKLAVLARVSQAHIAKIEQGKVDPRLSTVNRIIEVLKPGQERKCRDIMTRGVILAKPGDSVMKASEIMVANAVSQLPVADGNRIVGTITEQGIIGNLGVNVASEKVRKIMDPPLPEVQEDTNIEDVRALLERNPGVLIKKGRELIGIVTRSDLLKTIS